MRVRDFVRENIRKMSPYIPGKSIKYVRETYGVEKIVKLASNENPFGPSPKAVEALKNVSPGELSIYPETFPSELLSAIEFHTGWEPTRVVVGAGLDGVMETLFRIVIDPGDSVILPIPTYPYYHTLLSVFGAKGIFVERNDDFSIDTDRILEACEKEKPKILMLCSPNNPTGNVEKEKTVREIAENCNCLIFIDEAYGEFAEYEGKSLKKFADYENVIIGRTLSKAFGLANLRVGYAVMSEELKREYEKATTPFPISTPAALAASAALRDVDYLNFVLKNIAEERKRLVKELRSTGLMVYDSCSNFLFVKVPNASAFVEKLMRRGIIIRDCSKFIGCKSHVRISVGKKDENDLLIETVREVVSEGW